MSLFKTLFMYEKKLLFVYFTDKSDLMIRRLFRLLNLYVYIYIYCICLFEGGLF